MFTPIMNPEASNLAASMRGKAFRVTALLGRTLATSVVVNTPLSLADSHIR